MSTQLRCGTKLPVSMKRKASVLLTFFVPFTKNGIFKLTKG